MNADDDGGLFAALLEDELQRRVASLRAPSQDVRRAAYRAVAPGGKTRMSLLSSLAAASSKAAIGLTAAGLVVGGGSAAAAASGSPNPAAWGRTVVQAVATCKSGLGDGQHGIGQCVSAVARKHGAAERAAHPSGGDHAQPGSSPSPHPTGKGSARGMASPTSHATGKPSGVPVGPPANLPPAAEGEHPTGPPVSPPAPRHQ